MKSKNESLISKHAKSFSWAGFFLPKKIFIKCSHLYDFCRTLDDIADSIEDLETKRKKFLSFKKDFSNKNYSNEIIKNIHILIDDNNISDKIIHDLFDGVETDLRDEVKINSKKELIIYSYRVAGTVGLMMAKILNVKDYNSLISAADLGIAMQLTNISRDVIEDKGNGRFYIDHNFETIKATIKLADKFYNDSFIAIKSIPLHSRLSILVARRVYKKIGTNILKQSNLENYNKAGKIYVNNYNKILETFFSFFDLFKLMFTNNENHKLNIDKEINLNERI